MMQHAFLHWPDEFQVQLWPIALGYACWLHNHTPSNTHGWAPLELFCRTQVDCQHLATTSKSMGLPFLRLEPHTPRWKEDSKVGT
jgi:hypothetical protein